MDDFLSGGLVRSPSMPEMSGLGSPSMPEMCDLECDNVQECIKSYCKNNPASRRMLRKYITSDMIYNELLKDKLNYVEKIIMLIEMNDDPQERDKKIKELQIKLHQQLLNITNALNFVQLYRGKTY